MPISLNPITGQLDLTGASSSGTGDVVGPASSTDGAAAVFDGVTGKLIKEFIGTANTLARYDASGALASFDEFTRDVVYGGLNAIHNVQPNDLAGISLHSEYINFDPLQDSPDEQWNIHNIYVQFDVNNSGFSQGVNGTAVNLLNVGFGHSNTGNVGGLTHLNLTQNLGNGTDPFTLKGQVLVNHGGSIAANVTIDGFIQGYRFNPSVSASAIGTANFGIEGYTDYSQINIPVEGYNGYNTSPSLFAISNNRNYNGFTCSPQITTLTGNAGTFGFGFYPTITTQGATGQIVGFNVNPIITTMGASGSYQGVTIAGVVTTSHGQINGVNVSQAINGGDANYTGLNVAPSGTATLPSVQGLVIQLENLASSVQKTTIQASGGKSNLSNQYHTDTLPASPGFLDLHSIGSEFWVKPGDPTSSTLVFALNMGQSSVFEDDMGPDGFGGFLGYVALANVVQGGVAVGKTADTVTLSVLGWNAADVSGLGITDGGTIGTLNGALMLGANPGGGSVVVTDLYGFRMSPGFGTFATNSWGFHNDTATDNFLQRLAVMTTTQKVANSDVGVELGGDKALRLAQMTEATRDGLTALDGMMIFNTDSDCVEFYDGAAWQGCVSNVDGGTAGSVYGGSMSIDGGAAA